jgi:restriction system protein
MGSRLYVDTKRPGSRFRRVSRGVFDLAEAQPSDIAQRIEALNRKTHVELRKRLRDMPADRFEALIGELLLAIGFDEATVEVTRYGGDGGIDVRGVLNAGGITEVNAAVQAKRWKRNVQVRTVRELRGSLTAHEQGIIITTSDFSSGARKEAEEQGKTRISLINCEQLLELLIDHGIGVTQEQHTLLSLDEEWWGELTGEEAQPPAPPLSAKPAPPPVTYPLPIQAMAHGQTREAELLDATGRTRYAGEEYRSPSGAGQVASGWKSCNGWTFWRYQHPDTGEWRAIDELRGGKAPGA